MTADKATNLAAVAAPQLAVEPDLVRQMALDIGKQVAAHIEMMYPKAVEATSASFLTSVRNSIYNEIIEALATTDPVEIERRLKRRQQERRKLRAMHKATKDIGPGDEEKAQAILDGRLFLEPDH